MRVSVLLALLVMPVASIKIYSGVTTPTIEDCWLANQETRHGVTQWVTMEDVNKAIFAYGLSDNPKAFVPKLSKDVGPLPTQHDFVSQLGARMQSKGQRVKYLEIGVSVLKGVHTQARYFRSAQVTALDIEDPNPTIENLWANKQVIDKWTESNATGDMRRNTNHMTDYINKYDGCKGNTNNNTLFYVAGDAFNPFTYKHVAKTLGRQDLILSDGMHTGDAVAAEVDQLLSYSIIRSRQDKDFAMVWDDCEGDIRDAFYHDIAPKLRKAFKGRAICHGDLLLPGWLGRNERAHGTCVFTTFDLSGPHLGASKTWMPAHNAVQCDH